MLIFGSGVGYVFLLVPVVAPVRRRVRAREREMSLLPYEWPLAFLRHPNY
jgi:hypothetical protein